LADNKNHNCHSSFERNTGLYDLVQIYDDFFCAGYLGNSWPTSSNIYVISDHDGLTLIDTGIDNSDCLSGLSSSLEKIGRRIEDVHTIILTHGHPDHIGGTNAICRRASPRVFLPEASLPEAVDPVQQDYYCLPPEVRAVAPRMHHFDILDNFRRTCGSWELDAPRPTVIRDGERIQIGRYVFQALHTPGHDIGLMCFYEPTAKIFISGDLLRSTGPGSALPWYTSTAGGVEAYLHSLERICGLEVQAIFPAHGTLDGAFDAIVKKTRDVILGRESKILSLLRQGPKTCEQLDSHLYRAVVLDLCPWYSTVTESHLSRLESAGTVKHNRLNYCIA
jgi:glyoxylase-like metal-dependent hydrolase (beta-lactamase superfamily II)